MHPDVPELSIAAIMQWLRSQPPAGEYTWQDPVFCLVGRYLADHGSQWGVVSYSDMPEYHRIAGSKPWTYGAALERAQEVLALPAPTPALPAPAVLQPAEAVAVE
jgi:hypothetical protein